MNQKELDAILAAHKDWLNDNGGKRANLQSADLRSANLRSANLRSANLRYADLQSADLRYANLQSADLRYADLQSADLRYADLQSADLRSAENINAAYILPYSICPTGAFIGWKKLREGVIAKLQIPASADRVTPIGARKLRASKVKTLGLWDRSGNKIDGQHRNGTHGIEVCYEIGKYTLADSFNDDIREVCTNGIHFFLTREEAEKW